VASTVAPIKYQLTNNIVLIYDYSSFSEHEESVRRKSFQDDSQKMFAKIAHEEEISRRRTHKSLQVKSQLLSPFQLLEPPTPAYQIETTV
jgi:hypothetical protein